MIKLEFGDLLSKFLVFFVKF
uniref:Uncharacterized protein n=1 Tax=Arundo donax TaxID=35708 RepID=A0A0A8Y2T8_ARUDO